MTDQPKVIAQVVISLLENHTTRLDHTHDDEIMNRGLIDKARSILDWQSAEAMRKAQADAQRILSPNGATVRRIVG